MMRCSIARLAMTSGSLSRAAYPAAYASRAISVAYDSMRTAERREFALGIDHEMLDATMRLLEQLPDEARLAATAVRLGEES